MPLALRIFHSGDVVRVWICDQDGHPLRELQEPLGHPGGPIDWARTAESCTVLPGAEGVELRFVPQDEEAPGA